MTQARTLPASLALAGLLVAATRGAAQQGAPTQVPFNITRETVILAAERLEVDRMYPPPPPSRNGVPVDLQILQAAEQSPIPNVREAFVRALGRFERPADVERIALHVNDPAPLVRQATVRALVQALVNAKAPDDSGAIQIAFDVLRGQLASATAPNPIVLASIGELPLDSKQAAEAVRLFAFYIGLTPTVPAAMQGLASLARHSPDLAIPAETRVRLRQFALRRLTGPDAERPVARGLPILFALRALDAFHDHDEHTLMTAAAYRCPPGPTPGPNRPPPDCGWEFRYLAVRMMNGVSDAFSQALHSAEHDLNYHVRMAALDVEAQAASTTKTCWPLISALNDSVPSVVFQAIDLMSPTCEEHDDIASRLRSYALDLGDAQNASQWQPAVHALVTLAKFLPDDAKRIANETAAPHEVWQVRAGAARVASVLKDEALAKRLMKDDTPNVRTAALTALAEMRSPALVQAATDSLDATDYQLVLYAASFLKRQTLGPALADEFAATGARRLMPALERLTADDKDTSRDPRLMLLARIGEYGDPHDTSFVEALSGYLKDVDPVVASAAADAIGALTGTRREPEPTRRPIDQPTEADLQLLRHPPQGYEVGAQIFLMDGSVIDCVLLIEDAPLTVFRFKKLASEGYYDHLTFHRLDPDLLMQGGSPGANEYVGAARFWRDEISAPHVAGALAVSTRGRHTGDGQFFIDLMDAPQFDHDYTVFGRASCVPLHLQEGAVIARVVAPFVSKPSPHSEPCK